MFFPTTGRDDSHILYWPAYTLVQHGKIVNYSGEYLQQASGLTHTVLLGVLHYVLPLNLVVLGWTLSVGFGLMTVFLVIYFSSYLGQSHPLLVGFLTATSFPLAYWTFSGMETSLYAFLILLFLLTFLRFLKSNRSVPGPFLGISMVLLVFARTEAPLVIFAFLLGFFGLLKLIRTLAGSRFKFSVDDEATAVKRRNVLFFFALVFASKLGFQFLYFGSILPQPLKAKVLTGGSLRLLDGLRYVLQVKLSGPMVLMSILYLLVGINLFYLVRDVVYESFFSLEVFSLSVFLVVYLAFVLFSGGDWMEGGRFLAPSMGLFYLLVTAGLSRLASYNMRKFTLVSLLLIQFLVLGSFLHHKSTSLTGWQLLNRTEPDRYRNHPWVELGNKTNRRDVQALEKLSELGGLILRQQQTLTLMTGQAGLIGYYLAREFHPVLTFVDRRGLVSGHLMNCAREIGLNSSRFGLLFPWIFYLQNQRTMNQECFGVTPDLFYGMRESKNLNVKVLNKYGLEPVYFQPAEPLYPDDTLLPGYEKRAFLVVLLRNELVNKLSLQVKQEGGFRNYGILP